MVNNARFHIKKLLPAFALLMVYCMVPDSMAQGTERPFDSIATIENIIIEGNKTTRESIIFRELLIAPGDAMEWEELRDAVKKSRENLLNTQLFNFVKIETEPVPETPAKLTIRISVVERWYIWPVPILKISDRNFNIWWETKDFSRLSYGFYLDWNNVRGRMENLVATVQLGYDELLEFQYKVPYVNYAKTIGMGLGAGYKRNRETAFMTKENRLEFYSAESGHVREDFYFFYDLFLRPDIYNTHQFRLRYDHHSFADSLAILNPYYADGQNLKRYLSLYYKFKSDHRDFQPYPLEGYYFDFEAVKYGLGLSDEKGVDFFSFASTFRKYWNLSGRWYYATGLNARFSGEGHQPWFMVRGIGYDRNVVRSYEYFVIDGQNFGILKNNLKFALLPKKEYNIPFIRSEKFGLVHFAFYLNLFADIGYVDNSEFYGGPGNDLENSLLVGYGAGIDFVTYYDIVIRAEYSFNRMGGSGLFIHFRAPI
jgi:outer membrane protein assembly factor BamA